MVGDQHDKPPTEEGSQIMIDGISIPENNSTLNKVSKERGENPSTLQVVNQFGVTTEMGGEHVYEHQLNSNT